MKIANGRAVWRVPLCAAFVAIAVLLPVDVGWPDFSFLFNLFLVAPLLLLITLAFLVYVLERAIRSRLKPALTLSLFTTVISVWGIAVFLEFHNRVIRDEGRWLIWSRKYKAEISSEPTPPSGHLRYIPWDSWGMFAQDSDEFLVFDPTDSIGKRPGSDPGIEGFPPDQFVVRRLESHWYLITYPF